MSYPRDLIGYGRTPPDPKWPGGARIAVQFVMNYEEGSEYSIPDGDGISEGQLGEAVSTIPQGQRDLAMESVYEFGSRVGFWRLYRLFAERDLPATVFGCALALERNPEAAAAMVEARYDICCHGWRWWKHWLLSEEEERASIRTAVASIEKTTGRRPLGWYCRYGPSVNTRRLIVEEGGFLYDSDAYNDELPYWVTVDGKPHLVIPYTNEVNDSKFANPAGFSSGEDFLTYLRDTFDMLYREGETQPKMMSIGLHMRIAGRPGRAASLARFLDYVQEHDKVWICRREDIARHWLTRHPFTT
ncbi:MAG: allantoinase PuuE [Gemmatimonadales bacterium]